MNVLNFKTCVIKRIHYKVLLLDVKRLMHFTITMFEFDVFARKRISM